MIKCTGRLAVLGVVVLCLGMAGCISNEYEIALKPVDDGIERTITCRSVDAINDVSARIALTELELIADAYGSPIGDLTADEHSFSKVFAGDMPSDVGGSGSYRRWESPLGSLSIYVERFRGNDDLLTEIENRHEAIDRTVDQLLGWLATELEGEEGFAKLRRFIDQVFRRDLKNLCLYAWVAEMMPVHNDMTVPAVESGMRIGQYFVERSYFTIEETPEIVRAMQEYEATEHPQRILKFVQRLLARKMGVDDEVPACLNFLGHPLAVKKSLDDYLSGTPEYAELLEEWEQQKAENPDAEKPEPAAVVMNRMSRAFLPSLIGASDRLNLKLAAENKPFATNGSWDAKKREVQWERTMLSLDSEFFENPSLLFALWSQPNQQVQQDLFGKTILDGTDLAQYCLWYRGLNKDEAQQWESLLRSFSPGDQIIEQLKGFRFAHEPPAAAGQDDDDDLAATARGLIMSGMADE